MTVKNREGYLSCVRTCFLSKTEFVVKYTTTNESPTSVRSINSPFYPIFAKVCCRYCREWIKIHFETCFWTWLKSLSVGVGNLIFLFKLLWCIRFGTMRFLADARREREKRFYLFLHMFLGIKTVSVFSRTWSLRDLNSLVPLRIDWFYQSIFQRREISYMETMTGPFIRTKQLIEIQ